ncbi:NAD-dependent epimerase/dehydratase family protein, partial [Micromonospora palythoicola]|uniref:NAD-dependent epimerase/dehydratase family protein n=1 Tax=Micromonospora palythoicola TaxID=3120507 RepID=UPI002FCE184A
MRILMAGASGFLGTRLVDLLVADGHQVTRLVRRPPRGGPPRPGGGGGGPGGPAGGGPGRAPVH